MKHLAPGAEEGGQQRAAQLDGGERGAVGEVEELEARAVHRGGGEAQAVVQVQRQQLRRGRDGVRVRVRVRDGVRVKGER